MGSSCIAQRDQLSALWPPRGVGKGGWEGDARGRGYGDICIHIADSLCYTAEINIVKQLYSNKDVKKERKKERKSIPRVTVNSK